jgi:hypothetical protein
LANIFKPREISPSSEARLSPSEPLPLMEREAMLGVCVGEMERVVERVCVTV